ncbi:MAG: hypothetical protein KF744_01725 [Taibaiella sp.]|nr:hypothetical protein [Taibaiella sp.]
MSKYALNYPVADDFNAIVQFLNEYRCSDLQHKTILLFSQHNEHRILLSRIIYVLYDTLPGNINLRTIIYIGNIQLLVSFAVFLYFIYRLLGTRWFWPGFISSLCFFDLSNWEIAYSPMGSVANYSVIMLFFLAAFCYSLAGKYPLILALVFQILAFFSLGSGLIACVALVMFNLLNGQWTKVIWSGLTTAVSAVFYFHNFSLMGSAALTLSLSKTILFFARYMSGHFAFYDLSTQWVPVVIGFMILFLVVLLLPFSRKFRLEHNSSFFVATLLCCLGSSLLTSIFRSAISPIPSYRYLIFAHLIFSVLAVFFFLKFTTKKFDHVQFAIVYVLIINYLVNIHVGVTCYESTRRWILSAQVQHPDVEGAKREMARACNLGIYCWPHDHGR